MKSYREYMEQAQLACQNLDDLVDKHDECVAEGRIVEKWLQDSIKIEHFVMTVRQDQATLIQNATKGKVLLPEPPKPEPKPEPEPEGTTTEETEDGEQDGDAT